MAQYRLILASLNSGERREPSVQIAVTLSARGNTLCGTGETAADDFSCRCENFIACAGTIFALRIADERFENGRLGDR